MWWRRRRTGGGSIKSHDMGTPKHFIQLDRRIRHVLTARPSQLEEDIEEGAIRSSGRERRAANVFPLLFPFSQGLTEITQPRKSLIREPCMLVKYIFVIQ